MGKRPVSFPLKMEVLSREYGWTPSEIRQLSVQEVTDYWTIIQQRKKLEQQSIKQKK